jgi:2-phospho-L-lactate/phosphoenolpyruvate guanylyltransferase
MRTVAILPIKSFHEAKKRLAEDMTPGERRVLAEAMFSDVLVALRRTQSVASVIVVTADAGAQQIAGGYGAVVLDDDDSGHNPAAQRGIALTFELGADRALLVPGDCPLIDPDELDQLMTDAPDARSALIVPDRHGTGTNALLLTPPNALAPSFGPDSCRRHEQAAQGEGTIGKVVHMPSLALDVDTPEDLDALRDALAERHGGAAHTRGMLRQLRRSRV